MKFSDHQFKYPTPIPLLLFFLLLMQLSCREAMPKSIPKPPVIQYDYLITLDPVNWLWQISTNQNDSTFLAMLEASAIKAVNPDQHPLVGLSDSITKEQFKLWFADLAVGAGAVVPDQLLRNEFHRGIIQLKQLILKRLNNDESEVVSIEENELDQLRLRIRTVAPAHVNTTLFSPKSQVGFYEMYSYSEMIPILDKLKNIYQGEGDFGQKSDFLDLLEDYEAEMHPDRTAPMINEERPVIGFVSRDNIPLVDSLLHSPDAKAVIPNTLRFAWNQYPLEEWPDLFQLLALKTNSFGKPRVPGTNIRYARQDFEPYSTMPMVSIEMDEDGTAEWRRLTRTSIGRNVAIVVDGIVLTFPTIQGEISAGRAQITGLFSLDEAIQMAASIRAGSFPATVYTYSKDSTIEQR